MSKVSAKQRPTTEIMGMPEERREQISKSSLQAAKWSDKSPTQLLIQAMKEDPETLALVCAPGCVRSRGQAIDHVSPFSRHH